MSSIPLSASHSDPEGFARRLGESFEETGFAVIGDHGVPRATIERAEAAARDLFALPAEVKARYRTRAGQRGYTPFGVETAKGAAHHDLKEFWHVGRELPAGHPHAAAMPPNVWPDEVAAFREATLELFAALDGAGRRILGAVARYLQVGPAFFEDAVRDGNSILRLLHYPPVDTPAGSLRAEAHEDINAITLLLGADEPGLQLLDRSGRWREITPAEGELVVNVGDMLQRLTNGVLRSTTHRVVNPSPERSARSRYSFPYFLHFRPDFEIRTLPGCVSRDRPDAFAQPITADAYLQERLREIKLA